MEETSYLDCLLSNKGVIFNDLSDGLLIFFTLYCLCDLCFNFVKKNYE